MAKKGLKRKLKTDEVSNEKPKVVLPLIRRSDEPIPKKVKWINKERILVFATRGISFQHRHLMKDVIKMLPHSKPANKMERKENLFVINEMCKMANCNKCILFDGRLQRDLYMWFANISDGPSVKFHVESIYTSAELKLTGNCLKGSRPILSFDKSFDEYPQYALLREMFIQIFGVPNYHPKSQPFVDNVLNFSVLDNRIWFRNYQILDNNGAIAEIGPRFVLQPIRIFKGSFSGETLWENPFYITPAKTRRLLKESKKDKYTNNKIQRKAKKTKELLKSYRVKPEVEMFRDGNIKEKAIKLLAKDKKSVL
ncbi:ribosome biogenesis protein BRX1 homolog [Daktulosphaira vitifoliae]|uniref:ribosome biogenesis protein BRX1 homolog n=1 Tax=Daktulosphaira vitifoliae TaxID=58002 RepID=UPI0021AA62A9|nr:ribosome biogenesis protein BRX1 homolog [Daktulosphaira vitifoliae]XP_050531933.1 ribosome biogenesis protein BRX1 homolog [Daktulosphaira vitifoliae]